MRILIYSDLHLEFPDALRTFHVPLGLEFDAVILAGDIHSHTHGLRWAANTFAGKLVIYVPGNHEYYGAHLFGLLQEMRKVATEVGIHLLEQDQLIFDGIRFLGTTLWTDFELFGTSTPKIVAMREAGKCMPDFRTIRIGASRTHSLTATRFAKQTAGILQPEDTVKLFERARNWLSEKLAEPFDGMTVVVTHHLPSQQSVATRFENDPVSGAFASKLDELVAQANLWVHGHTHDSFEYTLGKCRVICNPRGYPRSVTSTSSRQAVCDKAETENLAFRNDLVIEL